MLGKTLVKTLKRLIGKDPDAGKGKRRRGQQRMRWLDSITNSTDMNLRKLQKTVEDRGVWHATVHGLQRVRHNLVTEQQSFLSTHNVAVQLVVILDRC